jgi:hypothetical protein
MYIILDGVRRINMNFIKEYKPFNKSTINGDYFQIELIGYDDKKNYLHFFKNEEERDETLKLLDKNFIINNS